MAWHGRKGSAAAPYYYRSLRVNGRPVSQYLGRGPEAERAAAEIAARRREREEMRAELADDADLDAALDGLLADCKAVMKAAMIAAGVYNHKGTWRRTRNGFRQRRRPAVDTAAARAG